MYVVRIPVLHYFTAHDSFLHFSLSLSRPLITDTQDGGFSHEPAAPTNHTTRWAFERPPQNQQKPTHLVVQIGANDQGYWNTSAIVHAEVRSRSGHERGAEIERLEVRNVDALPSAEKTYANFLRSLRLVHPVPIVSPTSLYPALHSLILPPSHALTSHAPQPIFVVDYWGWPQPKGPNQPIYPGVSEQVVQLRQEDGDMDVHYVPTGMEWVE